MLLGQRHAEHADRGQFVDHLDRDQPVGAVPLMRERRDGALGETADLIADHFEGRVVQRIAPERGRLALRDQRRQTRTRLAEPGDETRRIAVAQRRDLRFRQAEIGGADDFRLRHRDAAGELRQIFAERDPQDQRFRLAEFAGLVEARRPSPDLAQRLDIGRHPGEAVYRGLLAVDQRRVECAARRHKLGDMRPRLPQNRFRSAQRPLRRTKQFVAFHCSSLRHRAPARYRDCGPDARALATPQ